MLQLQLAFISMVFIKLNVGKTKLSQKDTRGMVSTPAGKIGNAAKDGK